MCSQLRFPERKVWMMLFTSLVTLQGMFRRALRATRNEGPIPLTSWCLSRSGKEAQNGTVKCSPGPGCPQENITSVWGQNWSKWTSDCIRTRGGRWIRLSIGQVTPTRRESLWERQANTPNLLDEQKAVSWGNRCLATVWRWERQETDLVWRWVLNNAAL